MQNEGLRKENRTNYPIISFRLQCLAASLPNGCMAEWLKKSRGNNTLQEGGRGVRTYR